MKMGKDESKAEMKKLLAGETTQQVVNECTFFYSCNSYCQQGLRPYNLIMERMVSQNKAGGKGIPAGMDYMMTGKNESGYFFDVYKAAPAEDKAILEN
jgi:hypothetical protein